MRITSKGQVTIPIEIRERAGLLPQTEVEFTFDGNAVRIVRAKTAQGRRSRRSACPSFARKRRCHDEHGRDHGSDPRRLNDSCPD